jgi:hypothetical protein
MPCRSTPRTSITLLGRGRGRVRTLEHFVHVTRCVPQLKALGAPSYVDPNDKSLDAALDVSAGLFPHFEILGDYHSHPYSSLPELTREKGWEYSGQDEISNQRWYKHVRDRGHTPVVGFVIAVGRRGKSTKNVDHKIHGNNTYRLIVSGCEIVIGAHRILRNGKYSSASVTLHSSVSEVSPVLSSARLSGYAALERPGSALREG